MTLPVFTQSLSGCFWDHAPVTEYTKFMFSVRSNEFLTASSWEGDTRLYPDTVNGLGGATEKLNFTTVIISGGDGVWAHMQTVEVRQQLCEISFLLLRIKFRSSCLVTKVFTH